ncbi:Peroxyureidoacrylate/ureidoacrylate amidohydrolase RutB [Lasiodiplodia hormozganensis]|uniref:Peroxyureidoacrylate/ureidoacrylate amidohydrolase RutB n=1 Tax=Lasiodiplodia hormozganensis TaxID=869390 RepID=A0AA40CLW0_9PEZI|nr:Peroxyureidoacrylate/ureidoacrylate amidohydrolase RutB [Lasiodiplodia hormozganensis]
MVVSHIAAAVPYAWPFDASFSQETTALVIIDMQNDFCTDGGYITHQGHDISGARAIIPAIQAVLHAFRKAGWQVYHTREGHRADLSTLAPREAFRSRNNPSGQGIGAPSPLGGRLLIRGGKGHDIIPELYPIEGEPIVDKPGKGAFAHTDFELLLRNRGIRNLLMAGVTTDVCVSTTVREASDRGFDCAVLKDACASVDAALHEATLSSIAGEGGIFGTVLTVGNVLEAMAQTGAR